MARCSAARLVMAVLLAGRKPRPVSVVAASLSEDKTSMVALGLGARRFCFCSEGGGVPSSLLLSLPLLFKSSVAFTFLLFLEGRAVSLLDGVCFEYERACLSEENPRNFVASSRVSNLL